MLTTNYIFMVSPFQFLHVYEYFYYKNWGMSSLFLPFAIHLSLSILALVLSHTLHAILFSFKL